MAFKTARKVTRKLRRKPDPAKEESLAADFPTHNPATNLLLADIVMRTGTYMLRGAVEKSFLRGRYGSITAENIVENKSMAKTVMSVALAKFATKSVPGAVIVGGGILGKTILDRSKKRRQARKEGDKQLLAKAKKAD